MIDRWSDAYKQGHRDGERSYSDNGYSYSDYDKYGSDRQRNYAGGWDEARDEIHREEQRRREEEEEEERQEYLHQQRMAEQRRIEEEEYWQQQQYMEYEQQQEMEHENPNT